ncbi:protein EI24 homolog isoform X2 [Rhodamnia argentea]|uniref:Protein EI24 homolog isoform X2 n=1 Tax=Rhodamnia argentea TaxID=178133 RepID=A0ABM3HE60_9MYRT|nr:protein EI24 homolog isoform X2 [Rhodamnia argentea]
MESAKPWTEDAMSKMVAASRLWFAGFADACCLHRVVSLCLKSKKLSIRTGQCFLLNGFIFLGSILVLHLLVIPTLQWILPENCCQITSQDSCPFSSVLKLYSFLHFGLVQLLYVFWFYPLYIFSFILSAIWYSDIAKHGFAAMEGSQSTLEQPSSKNEAVALERKIETEKLVDLGGLMIGIGEQVYSILLLTFFFLEVYVLGFVPYIGKPLNILLLSWMYAYYCFEYKWNFTGVSLDKRLDFFESNWAFFAGFGNPCVLASFFFSPLVGYGVMAILFPLFVLTATSSRAEQAIFSEGRKKRDAGIGRLPIFYAADTLSMWVLGLFSLESREQLQEKKMH